MHLGETVSLLTREPLEFDPDLTYQASRWALASGLLHLGLILDSLLVNIVFSVLSAVSL